MEDTYIRLIELQSLVILNLDKLPHNQHIIMETIEKLCEYLKCNPEELMEYTADDK